MRRINPRSLASAKSIVLFLFVAIATLSTALMAVTTEVTPYYVTANGNDHYDRNPSFVQFGGENWLFYTKGDYDSTQGVRMSVYNPDNDSYTIWYRRASTPLDVVTAPETRLDLSATARPVGFDQRDVSAVVYQGDLYVFASAGFGGSQQPIYYYKWDGATWTGPTALLTGGGGHANAVADADRVYFTLEKGVPDTMRSVAYTWDGTIFNGPYVVANNNGVPKLTLKDGILYAVSIAPGANVINLHTSPVSATPSTWSYISNPITVSDAGVYVWDPSIYQDGTNLYVLAAPSTGVPDRQWIVQTRSTDNGATWAAVRTVSSGGPGNGTTWWDYWPVGFYNNSGRSMIYFATEGYNGVYLDGMIGETEIVWNLDNDHLFYIQPAIDIVSSGDTVQVGNGVYQGKGNRDLDFNGKLIVLKSKNSGAPPFIFCGGTSTEPHHGIYFHSGEDLTAILDGFEIGGAYDAYAAVRCSGSSPTIRNCFITDNNGGGVLATDGSNPQLLGCRLSHNTGRGLEIKGANPLAPPVVIMNCSVYLNGDDGIWMEDANASIDSTNIIDNAGDGLHVDSYSMELTVSNVMSRGNNGYGIFISYWGGAFSVKSCTVVDNIGGFGYDFEMPKGNEQTGLAPLADSSFILSNIVAYNRGFGLVKLFVDAPYLAARCNDVYGNISSNYVGTPFGAGDNAGNLSLDPVFCDTVADNYMISSTSPCVPANNSCHSLIGKYGIGCLSGYLCGDANADGSVDIADVVRMISYIFSGGPAPEPLLAGDANCDGVDDISDAVYLIAYIFSGGPAPCADCPSKPVGTLLNMGDCKGSPTALPKVSDIAELRRCVQWQYNGVGTLLLKHVNATFNCCPQIETHVTITGNTITIQEIEIEGPCDCMCTYDLDFQISSLPAGEYTINVIEPYVTSPPLSFTANLVTTPTGEYCVTSN
jgi:hypothetical protein